MEQHGSPSDIGHPASISRVFKHRREYPALPKGYDWKTQLELYCPRNLLPDDYKPGHRRLKPEFGYVFCHRGLYERASGIIDNSAAAIANGTSQGFFLHEVDAFVLGKLDMAFIAHDKNPRRVTSKKEDWEHYPFEEIRKTVLVTRRVETEMQAPDFASSYLSTDEKIPGLLHNLLEERESPAGRTLQIDFRDEDFAKAIPYFSFHISKFRFQYENRLGAKNTLVSTLFKPTILKGYNMYFKSFDHLHHAVKEESINAYGKNYFHTEHLHLFPPLVMVFFSEPLVELAKATTPRDPSADRRGYEHLRHTFMNQVMSFVGVGELSYDFILEIVHSGLGLGYNVAKAGTAEEARNPLTGEFLIDKKVIFESRVDRAMIDVSLELREKYPRLLFSSCTRLPDVITPKQKLKANFTTSRLVPWKDGEEGLSTRLRAMHGGLYPQSHLVVADDPAAEIAARTWIDQKSDLDRSKLLHMPYDKWLARAKPDVVAAMTKLNAQDFLPNKCADPEVADDGGAVGDLHHSRKHENLNVIDSEAQIRSWLGGLLPPNDASRSDGVNPQTDDDEINTLCHDLQLAADESGSKNHHHDRSHSNSDAGVEQVIIITAGDKRFRFASIDQAKLAVATTGAYKAAARGNEEVLSKFLSVGANVNAEGGQYGSALAVACAKGHERIVELLLDARADAHRVGPEGSPLELASRYGHVDTVKMLLEVLKTSHGHHDTPGKLFVGGALYEASQNGHDAVVQLLLDSGADVDFPGGRYHHTALQAACSQGNTNIISMLLKRHADVNAPAGYYRSALQMACDSGRGDAAKLLLNNGAIVDFPVGMLYTPEIVSLLVNAGAELKRPEARNTGGRSSLTGFKKISRAPKASPPGKSNLLSRATYHGWYAPIIRLRTH